MTTAAIELDLTGEPGRASWGRVALEPVSFDSIPGWQSDDHALAFRAFRISARHMLQKPYRTKALGVSGAALAEAGRAALSPAFDNAGSAVARQFFETCFVPHAIRAGNAGGRDSGQGMLTAYYEPEAEASFDRDEKFRFPVYRRPSDLIGIDQTTRPAGIADHFFFARRDGGKITEYHDRKAIETGALDGQGLELVWLEDIVDIFFIHIQGSARLRMTDGSVLRISYDGKSGHPFTAIGKLLIERGEIAREQMSMQAIRDWLKAHPQEARELMWQNRSFIFFQVIDHPDPELGPVAAAGVPLTAGRSLAVDHNLHTFGSPVWVNTESPLPGMSEPFSRLMIAQDTGSAITGPVRGDIFMGSGEAAGKAAGAVSNTAQMIVLIPVATLHRGGKR